MPKLTIKRHDEKDAVEVENVSSVESVVEESEPDVVKLKVTFQNGDEAVLGKESDFDWWRLL